MFEMNQKLEMKVVQWEEGCIWQDLISIQLQRDLIYVSHIASLFCIWKMGI